MKRLLILTFIFICILVDHAHAQTYVTQVKDKTGRWGYSNLQGEMIIPATFQKCMQFTGNLAIVFDDASKQYYFLNVRGERVKAALPKFTIQGGYYSLGNSLFADGLLPVENGKWGYLNTAGKLAIPLKYEEAGVFNGGYAVVKTNKNYLIIDTTGKEIPINVGGKTISELNHFSGGLASYQVFNNEISSNATGFIDTKGNIAIKAYYKSVGYFIGGIAWAKTQTNKVGFIDSTGKWLLQPTFDEAHDFDRVSGLARIKIGGKTAYTDKTGKLYYFDTDNYLDYEEGFAVGEKNEKFGFINAKGEWVIPAQFEGVRSFKNGYAAAKSNDKWGVINKEGKWVITPQFYGIRDMEFVDTK